MAHVHTRRDSISYTHRDIARHQFSSVQEIVYPRRGEKKKKKEIIALDAYSPAEAHCDVDRRVPSQSFTFQRQCIGFYTWP